MSHIDDKSVHRHFWTALSQSASVDSFVCQTMRDSCPAVWAANDLTSLGECEAKLAALPLAEGEEFYMDGNTYLRGNRTSHTRDYTSASHMPAAPH